MDLERLPIEAVPCDQVPELLRRAEAAMPGPNASRQRLAVALSKLFAARLAMFRCSGDRTHWQLAVDTGREALRKVPRGHEDQRDLAANLANCLTYARTEEALDEAIRLLEGILPGLRAGSGEHATLTGELGLAHYQRYELGNRVSDLERSFALLSEALAGPRPTGDERAPLTMGFALTLLERSRRAGTDPAEADRAVTLLEELVRQGAGRGIVGFEAVLRTNLESARQEVARRSGDPRALDHLPELDADPAALLPGLGAQGSPQTLSALRSVLSAAAVGRLSETDRAIRLNESALTGMGRRDPSRAPLLTNAAHDRLARAHRRRRADPDGADRDVLRAEEQAREAVEVAVGVHVAGARVLLAQCLTQRYVEVRPRRSRDLDEAVRLLEGVLGGALGRADILPAARARYADALLLRALRDHRVEDLDQACTLRSEVVQRKAPGTLERAHAGAALAQALMVRADSTGLSDQQAEATGQYRTTVRGLEPFMPRAALDSAREWAHWAWQHGRIREAGEAYDWMLALTHRVTVAQTSRADKETVLTDASEAGSRAAYAHAHSGDFAGAVTALESVRAVVLAESLEREEFALDALRDVRPDLADRYRSAVTRLDRATHSMFSDDV
ncbi:hypothetical protein AB0D74_14090 [Streptomyces sp. NPDC048278]|uniref:hypothetical protein n=1 Tax=Streptomyces sp. NPDC048278 TaxID=3155809 RepID=UPI003416F1F6